MKNILLIIVIAISSVWELKAQGIKFFEGTWEQALAQAKKENKPLFVDAYTVWCGPCKYMSNNVFPVDSVGKFYNENFINVKYDMEKGDGPTFATNYRVTAYPTLLYLNPEGKVLHRIMGGRQPSDFIKEGRKGKLVFDYK